MKAARILQVRARHFYKRAGMSSELAHQVDEAFHHAGWEMGDVVRAFRSQPRETDLNRTSPQKMKAQ